MQSGTRLAAVDLGSNSFRLEIARLELGQLQRMEYHKETVRQGAGLDGDRCLSPDAMQRGWNCLARFAERLAGFAPNQVRAVATQTLREARNREEFLTVAQRILGFPIDVIAGREEARLIYQGVAHLLPQSDERRLVLDIGGRSTELIIGSGYAPRVMESYRLGSVAWSMRYFPDNLLSAKNFERAEIAAKAVLDDATATHGRRQWDKAYGCSGTVGAIADTLLLAGRVPERYLITREGLDWLRDKLIKAQHFEAIKLEGIKEERKAVIAGGLAVLRALFDLLDIETLQYAYGALRHGALYDMLDREQEQTDVRNAAVEALAAKFNVDAAQGARVSRAALMLFDQLAPSSLKKKQRQELERQIDWAARLHEIGSRISHADYHKHGAYILDHADVSGFAMHELHALSQLVLGHRGKLRKLEARFGDALFMRQLMALRLAVILCHARQDPETQQITAAPDAEPAHGFTLSVKNGWDERWPQSAHLLREEVVAWQKTPWGFRLRAGAR
ncbi:exopolyphosphatase [Ottowia testudinis]|uniref:Exopolyphosphatase n=1 Tax=Ottowia testudinis TaxID=2816950 RepID=A0A975H2W0_9BURK|nr:exopolyphosphatase [Ottowia testudinis]QTD44611.1 exopolyphosphatase [Ottowia testudinis]